MLKRGTFFLYKQKTNCIMNTIQREIKFNIGEKNFIAKFPNVGQMIDLESLKQGLTSNRYGIMSASGVKSMYMILDLVDAVAFFQICTPSVGKHFNIENYANIQMDQAKDLVQAYLTQIKPWFNGLIKQLYTESDEHKIETKGENAQG